MIPRELPAPAPSTSAPLEDALLQLVDLVERGLDGVPDEVRALRRALTGRHRPVDESLLAGRFQGARLCLVRASSAWTGAVEAELRSVPGLVWDRRGDDVVVLVPTLPRQASSGPDERVRRVVARVQKAAPTAAVGVSNALEGVGQAARGLDEATRVLAGCEPGGVAFADDAWLAIALSRMRDSLRDSLAVDGPLALLEDGLRSGADLRETLVAWLEADGDVRVAADRLYLHPNTLRYRLRRVAEITALDLEDPVQRLVVHVALTTGSTR